MLPKPVREQAGFLPGMELEIAVVNGRVEISPAPRAVRVERRGELRVAIPNEKGPALSQEEVWQTLRAIRNRRPRS